MAKIGSYIHYNYLNYVKNEGRDINSVMAAQRANIKKRALALSANRKKQAIATEIEDTLNFFKNNGQSAQLTWKESDAEEIEKAIEELVLTKLNIDENIKVDFKTLEVSDKNSLNIQMDKQGKKELSEKGNFNRIESIETRLKMLEATIKKNSEALSGGKLAEITTAVHSLQEQWKKITEIFAISAELQGMEINGIQAVRPTFTNKNDSGYHYIRGADNFIKQLNEVWGQFNKEVKSYLKGEVAEYYAGIVTQVVQAGTANAAKELLNTFTDNLESLDKRIGKVGKERSAVALQMDRFAVTGIGKNYENIGHRMITKAGQSLFTDFSGGKIKLHSTQDKVDLVINLQDGGTINASLKNYNLASSRGISVHSGVSIFSLMQQDENFLNHYLNITASVKNDNDGHPLGHPHNRGVFNWGKINLANRVLKESMVLRAISGGILKFNPESKEFGPNAQAEILILNDESGFFKVYFVDDLIDKIMSDVQSYVKIDQFDENTTWDMSWVGGKAPSYPNAYSRINALLSQLHSFKLHISISPQLFS